MPLRTEAAHEDIVLRLLVDRGEVYALTPNGCYRFSPEHGEWLTALALKRPPYPSLRRRVINVVLTLDCNYRCAYCWQRDIRGTWTEHPGRQLAVVRRIMAEAVALGEHVHLHFTGGEPLLRKAQLDHLVREALNQTEAVGKERASLSLITNGSLLDAEFAEYCAREGIGTCVSLDGGAGEKSAARRTVSGEPGFSRTMSVLSRCAGMLMGKLSLRATLHRSSPTPSGVYTCLAELSPVSIGFGFCLSDAPEELVLGPTEMDIISSGWGSLCSEYLARLRTGYRHTLQPVLSYLVGLAHPQIRFVRCGARAGRQIAVMPDGSVLPCENLAAHPEIPIDGASLSDTPVACLSCWARSFCGGPCLVDGSPSEATCAFTRRIIEETFRWATALSADDMVLLADAAAPQRSTGRVSVHPDPAAYP